MLSLLRKNQDRRLLVLIRISLCLDVNDHAYLKTKLKNCLFYLGLSGYSG